MAGSLRDRPHDRPVAATKRDVSVAMTTYNGAAYLEQQLHSLAEQAFRPTEMVVCDDASTDGTPALLHRFAATAPFPVQVVLNPRNLGWRANFIQAADLCRSSLIAFCDQDDIWYPRKLAVMTALFDDPATLLAYHDADVVDAIGHGRGGLRAGHRDRACLPPLTRPVTWESPLGLTLVIRRSLLAFSHYWPSSLDPMDLRHPAAHDQWFFALASSLGQVRYSPERLLGYRQHGSNAVGFDAVLRQRTGTDPAWERALRQGQIAMLSAFCSILKRAEADDVTVFTAALPAALAANAMLLHALEVRAELHEAPSPLARAMLLARLVAQGAYRRRRLGSFGYRALLGDAGAVLRP